MAGLYVHFPFCRSKCAYCDFYSQPRYERVEEYCRALAEEFAARRQSVGDEPFRTVYLGGGTPSSVPLELLAPLLETFGAREAEEVTIEVNPEDVSPEWIARLQELTPVNRVSIGLQSLDDDCLRQVGRRHTAAEAIRSLKLLIDAGLNVSADLIMGLPGQTLASWTDSLGRVLALRPQHLSAYILTYEPGTRLTARLQAGKLSEAPDFLIEAMHGVLCDSAARDGYEHYEVSNFALMGFKSRHNASYWDTSIPYLGLGPGAHSLGADGLRSFNPPALGKYLENPAGVAVVEESTPESRWNDYILTALRTARGFSTSEASARFGVDVSRELQAALKAGTLQPAEQEGYYRIPERHLLTSDAIILPFIR